MYLESNIVFKAIELLKQSSLWKECFQIFKQLYVQAVLIMRFKLCLLVAKELYI